MPVGIVTDSTAYLPESVAQRLGIEVVPVQVISGGMAYDEVGGISVDEVSAALRANKQVTTSRPTPERFVSAYQILQAAGCDSIVSAHLSSGLSGTYESALLASKRMDIDVEVIDSYAIAMMLGFAVESGAAVAQAGGSIADVVTTIKRRCAAGSITFYVDSLEFLERGGRISPLKSRVGSALSVKPLLHMINGKVEQKELVRTSAKALERLVEIASAAARIPSDIAVHHVAAEIRANQVAQELCEILGIPEITVTQAGAVVGAHVGPGAIAVVVSPQV
jgi:DegV family protein with EDD domain